ncbi:MAG: hypothetical protein KAX64_02280 [Chromatiaceae bacterium]|nr:hypothetical protein [Chromatiaceae bacterium]
MKEELDALSEKIAKLFAFLASDMYRSLADRDRELLNQQARHMLDYQYVLAERIIRYKTSQGGA